MAKLEKKHGRAFTLLELILVMIIICTMLAIAAPNLRGFFSSRQLNNVAEQMSILCRYARQQAINDGTAYRLVIDTVDREYRLMVLDQSQFRYLDGRLGDVFALPQDVELAFENVPLEGNSYYIEFTAEGYGSECAIEFEDKANHIALYRQASCDEFKIIDLNDND